MRAEQEKQGSIIRAQGEAESIELVGKVRVPSIILKFFLINLGCRRKP